MVIMQQYSRKSYLISVQQCFYFKLIRAIYVYRYGATSAGKTYTMMGREVKREDKRDTEMEYEQDGIIPHCLSDVFKLISERKEQDQIIHERDGVAFEYKVKVSYLEVYNEQIKDLLNKTSDSLQLREDPGIKLDK